MEQRRSPFSPGDRVRRRSNPAQVGTVVGEAWHEGLQDFMIQVRMANSVRGYPAFELQRLEGSGSDPFRDLLQGELGDARAFRLLLACERLRHLPAPLGGRFIPARARFVPHQFKPLLKLLEQPSPRFLLADADGLGKTLAAGYIVREWLERRAARHVLVVTPLGQRGRWSAELRRRFSVPLDAVQWSELRQRLQSVKRGWEMNPFTWVVSYEGLELPEVAELLDTLRPNLDLLILDEAEQSFAGAGERLQAVRALTAMSDACVGLCGAPVRSRPEELFALLELLEPQRFGSGADVAGLMATAQVSSRVAEQVLAGSRQGALEGLEMLAAHPSSGPLQADALFKAVKSRLQEPSALAPEAMTALLRALEGLPPVASMISRTRIAPAFEAATTRIHLPIPVTGTALEERLYQGLERAIFDLLPSTGEALLERVCLPYRLVMSTPAAGLGFLENTLEKPGLWLTSENALAEADVEREVIPDAELRWEADEATRAAVRSALTPVLDEGLEALQDIRLDALLHTLVTLWREDEEAAQPARKVVIFSRFPRTLRCLAQQLTPAGFETRLVSSGLSLPEQQTRVEQWATRDDLRILLCTDAGGLGLDLQAASLVVHYDLPWEPALLELRMSRVDCPGQQESRLLVVTVTQEGSLEHRLLLPLYQAIGLLERPRRALEGAVSAEEVMTLIAAAITPSTPPETLLAQQQALVKRALERLETRQEAMMNAEPLFPADAALTLGLEQLLMQSRWPVASEVRFAMLHLLATHFPGVRLDGDPMRSVGRLDLTPAAVKAVQSWAEKQGDEARALAGRLGFAPLPVTFDADVASVRQETELLQPGHPLVSFAIEQLEPILPWVGRGFRVQVRESLLAAGAWAVGIWRMRLGPPREGHHTEVIAWHPATDLCLVGAESEGLLQLLLTRSEKLETAELPPGWAEAAARRLKGELSRRQVLLRREVQALEATRLIRRRKRLEAVALGRAEAVNREVETLRRRTNSDPNAIRAANLRLGARRTMLDALRRVPPTPWPEDLETTLLAVLHLQVLS